MLLQDLDISLGLLSLLIGFCVVFVVAQRNRDIFLILLTAFCLRAALTIIDSFVYYLPGAGDGYGWDRAAAVMSRNGLADTFQYAGTGHELFKWLMSVLYAIFGRSPLMIKSINVTLGTLLVKSTWELSLLLGSDARRARSVAWILALCPSLIFFSAVLLREVAVTYPLVLSIVYLTRWYQQRKNVQLLAAFLALIVSMSFHSGGFAVLLFGGMWLIGNWFRSILTGQFRSLGRNTAALALGVAVVGVVLASGYGLQKFNGLESGDIDALTDRQEGFAHGRAAYLEDLHAGSPVDLLWQTPIRMVYFLFAPFPWMISTGSDAFGLIDSAIFALLTIHALRHRRALAGNPRIVLVLGVFGAMAMVFAIGVSNYGTALRHRNKMLPLLIASVISIPVERRRRRAEGLGVPSLPARAGSLPRARAWSARPVLARPSGRS